MTPNERTQVEQEILAKVEGFVKMYDDNELPELNKSVTLICIGKAAANALKPKW